MSCQTIQIYSCFEEGKSVDVNYSLKDSAGQDVNNVSLFEYTLSDGPNQLIPWTTVPAPDLPSGTIKIPGINNRVDVLCDRFVTIHTVYNGGLDDDFTTIHYQLKNTPNVTPSTP